MKFKILVVEDNEVSRELFDALLTLMGHCVIVAGNGQEAVDIYEKTKVDVILMDYHMPVMDGKKATIKIREIEKQRKSKPRTPIFSVSASLNNELNASLIDAGVDGFIPKPVSMNELNAFLKTQCSSL